MRCATNRARIVLIGSDEQREGRALGEIALVLSSAVKPRSIKSQDLNCGRFITDDLVLDLHPC